MSDFDILPGDLAKLRHNGRLTLGRSPITKRWRISVPEAGFEDESPNRHDLFAPARAAAVKVGLL